MSSTSSVGSYPDSIISFAVFISVRNVAFSSTIFIYFCTFDVVVAVFIFKIAFDLIRTGLDELLERSLPEDVEEEILRVVAANPEVREPHNLRTRRIGASIAVEVHVRVDGAMSVCRSHELTEDIERRLRARFGEGTMIAIHVEPLKAACRAE